MNKRIPALLICFASVLALAAGCAKEESAAKSGDNPNSVEQVLVKQMDEYEGTKDDMETETETETQNNVSPPPPEEADVDLASTEGVDVDLTLLSGTMLYSQVSYMMYRPEEFQGKTVKIPGTFNVEYSQDRTRIYYGCMVKDKSACCTLGVEFDMPETLSYPENYPEIDSPITVLGTFGTYEEDGYTYCVLRDARMVS